MTKVAVTLGYGPGHPAGTPVRPDPRPLTAPAAFHVLAKRQGRICNLDCGYCYFLSKEALYPGDRFRMADDCSRHYIRQVIEAQPAPRSRSPGRAASPPSWASTSSAGRSSPGRAHRRPGQTVEPHHPDQRHAADR